tara:strand:+ start:2720 stop:2854 length:135 start_codon:yes stop_codon:yes gene_type:complete
LLSPRVVVIEGLGLTSNGLYVFSIATGQPHEVSTIISGELKGNE